MKPTLSLKRGLARVRRHWLAGQAEQALAEVRRLMQDWPDNPHLLILWADLIQMQEEDEGPSLEEAQAAYLRAAELDDQSPAPLIELGHFLYAVEDDAGAASKYFTRAIRLCKRLLNEALRGQAKALAETGRKSEALACLAEAYWLEARNGKPSGGQSGAQILDQLKDLAQVD
jgi:Flp pilus assembly protein TadD